MDAADLDLETYNHLRALARLIHNERAGSNDSIQPTALMHEAWAKVVRGQYESRSHFMAVAARAMRQILVDRARRRNAAKRGGGMRKTTLAGLGGEHAAFDVLALNEALEILDKVDPKAARVAMLRTFGGMTAEEIAEAEDTSVRSVWRLWRFARAFLSKTLDS
jgi:RNA polymerase sigma factor (TIGR02999 family)